MTACCGTWSAPRLLLLAVFYALALTTSAEAKNCPLRITVNSFAAGELADGEMITAFLGSDIGEKVSIALADALQAQLTNAEVTAGSDTYMDARRESNRQKKEFQELKGRLERGEITQAEFDREALRLPGMSQELASKMDPDAIATGRISKLGNRFTIHAALLVGGSACARAQVTFSDKSEWQSRVALLAEELAEKVKDSFYCIDTDPHRVEVSGRTESFRVMFENLKGESVAGEKALFRVEKMDHGSVSPEVVEIEGGSAEAEYCVKKQLPNNILIEAKSSKASCSPPYSTQKLPVEAPPMVLLFSGSWELEGEIQEKGWNAQAQCEKKAVYGEIPLYIDYESGRIAGDGFYDRVMSVRMVGAGDSEYMEMPKKEKTERLQASVKGTVRDDGVARLVLSLTDSKEPINAFIWGTDAAGGYNAVNLPLPEREQLISLEPFEIELVLGAQASIDGSVSGPVAYIRRNSYSYQFTIQDQSEAARLRPEPPAPVRVDDDIGAILEQMIGSDQSAIEE